MRDAIGVVSRWIVKTADVLAPTPFVRACYRQLDRENQARSAHWIDWSDEDLGKLLQVVDQQRLEFHEEDSHTNVRSAVARYLEASVIPLCADPRLYSMPERLRDARQTGTLMYRRFDGRCMTIWDSKAGVPLLCPDDSREEGMRVARRYIPTIAGWRNNGKSVHKLVLNPPNIARGDLKVEMRALFKTFNKAFMKSGRFPEIKGALVSLEAPLSARGNWNVHLNVILLVDGFLDYNKIVSAWGHQFDAQRLRGDQAQIAAAMREMIKYAVQAMPGKSADHKRRGISEAPALIEWPGDAFLEWWEGHQHFRRTRSYGLLYGLEKPPKESLEGFEAIGYVRHDGNRLVRTLTLLDSIPGDKSQMPDHRERLRQHIKRLQGDPDRHSGALKAMARAFSSWRNMQKTED